MKCDRVLGVGLLLVGIELVDLLAEPAHAGVELGLGIVVALDQPRDGVKRRCGEHQAAPGEPGYLGPAPVGHAAAAR